MKKILLFVKPAVRGLLKTAFPGVNAIVETAKNYKHIPGVENKPDPHNLTSIVFQLAGAAFIWWCVYTGKIDVSKALAFFGFN